MIEFDSSRYQIFVISLIRISTEIPAYSAHPQGVQWDSLGSLRTVGGGEVVDTLALCTLFVHAVPAIILYVLYTL